MPETTAARMATLSGGISKLKAEMRSPGQVEDALNVDFSLQHNCSKRAGTSHLAVLGTSAPSSTWLISKSIEGGQKPVIYLGSDGSVQVLSTSGSSATVVAKPSATAYLASGSATTRPSVAGKTGTIGCVRIANPAVTPLAEASDSVTVAREHLNFETLVGHTGASIGEVRRVLESTTADRPAGLYRYEPGVTTASTAAFDWTSAGVITSEVVKVAKNPQGAKLWFPRFAINNATATYTQATRTITIANAFTNYEHNSNDEVFISGSGAGAYKVESRTDASNIVLSTDIGAFATVELRGIGMQVEFKVDLSAEPVATVDEYALALQRAIRDAGATNACVGWLPTDLAGDKQGKIVLTNHFSGALASFNSTAGMVALAPTSGPYSLLTADACFEDTTPTIVDGSGDGTAKSPFNRWVSRPVNDQSDAVIDADTMPALVKPVQGFSATTSYYDATVALKPVAYWRMGERYGTGVFDSVSDALGVANATPTMGATSLLTGDTNPAMTFASASSEYVSFANGIPNILRRGVNPYDIAFECLFKTTTTAAMTLVSIRSAPTGGLSQFRVVLNQGSPGFIRVEAKNGEYIQTSNSAQATIYDGNVHHLIATKDAVWLDGVAVAVTNSAVGPFGTSTTAAGFATIAATTNSSGTASSFFNGTIDEVAIHDLTATTAFAAWRNTRARGTNATALYMVGTEEWTPRTTGDGTTNPVPTFIRDGLGITAMTVWEGRLQVGASRTVSHTRGQEETAWFVKDASVVTDGAPIDRIVASTDASKITSLTPFGSISLALTDGPTQFELSAAGTLSIGTLNARAGYTQRVAAVDPVMVGSRIYFVAPTASGNVINGTLLEGELDEQAVAGFYDDVGQHVRGLINPASIDNLILCPIASDGKIVAVEKDTGVMWVYQTAFISSEKRQSAWSYWTGGTVKAACAVDESILMVVLRSGKYLLEKWKPEPPEQWPTGAIRLDGRVAVTSVSQGGGVTTFTMPTNVPATGIDTAIKADGTELAATAISSTQFTVPGLLHPIAVTAGRSYSSWVILSRPYQRDQNGQSYIGQNLTLAYVILTATDLSKISASVTVDSRSPVSWPVRSLGNDTRRGRAWTRGPVQRTSVKLILSGSAPVSIGTLEQVLDSSPSRS